MIKKLFIFFYENWKNEKWKIELQTFQIFYPLPRPKNMTPLKKSKIIFLKFYQSEEINWLKNYWYFLWKRPPKKSLQLICSHILSKKGKELTLKTSNFLPNPQQIWKKFTKLFLKFLKWFKWFKSFKWIKRFTLFKWFEWFKWFKWFKW